MRKKEWTSLADNILLMEAGDLMYVLCWTDAAQLSFVFWGAVAEFSNELQWHRLQSDKAKQVLRDWQSLFGKSEQAILQCGKISGHLITGCAPLAVTVGTQVLVGKFSSPPFYPSRWTVSCPVFWRVMIQVGRAGAERAALPLPWSCCRLLTLWGALTTLPRAQRRFPFLQPTKSSHSAGGCLKAL